MEWCNGPAMWGRRAFKHWQEQQLKQDPNVAADAARHADAMLRSIVDQAGFGMMVPDNMIDHYVKALIQRLNDAGFIIAREMDVLEAIPKTVKKSVSA